MMNVKETQAWLDRQIAKLYCDLEVAESVHKSEFEADRIRDNISKYKEVKRSIKVLGKFIGFYLVSSFDEDKNKIVLELDIGGNDVQEIEKYVNDCMDELYNERK